MRPDANPASSASRIGPAVISERIAVVAGGKGGVGTSVISSLLALGCAATGARVLLIDGHEGNGTLHLLFNVRPVRSIDALRDPVIPVAQVCMELGDSFTLVASKPASNEQLNLSADARRAPLQRLLPMSAQYDCVIVDAGSRLDGILAAAESGAGKAIVVTDADRISLAASYALLKVLATQSPAIQGSVLVNRHDDAVAMRAGAQLIDACMLFLNRKIELAGIVSDDACLRAAIGAGMPIGDAAQGSTAAETMQELALSVFPHLAKNASARSRGMSLGSRT
ncbi:MAG: cellulose synthase operon protein YhjQ/BcsQ [bacterium]